MPLFWLQGVSLTLPFLSSFALYAVLTSSTCSGEMLCRPQFVTVCLTGCSQCCCLKTWFQCSLCVLFSKTFVSVRLWKEWQILYLNIDCIQNDTYLLFMYLFFFFKLPADLFLRCVRVYVCVSWVVGWDRCFFLFHLFSCIPFSLCPHLYFLLPPTLPSSLLSARYPVKPLHPSFWLINSTLREEQRSAGCEWQIISVRKTGVGRVCVFFHFLLLPDLIRLHMLQSSWVSKWCPLSGDAGLT